MIIRNYRMTDLMMRQRCQTRADFFSVYKADFIFHFPDLADPFVLNWQNAVDNTWLVKSDLQLRKELRVFKTERDLKLKQVTKLLSELNKYLKLAFVNDHAGQKQFRLRELSRAYRYVKRAVLLIDLAFDLSQITDNQTKLTGAGFTLAKIAALQTASNELQQAQLKYLSTRKSRAVIKTNYIIAHNAAWKFMTAINIAAIVVFLNDKARRDLFGLYRGMGKKKGEIKNDNSADV